MEIAARLQDMVANHKFYRDLESAVRSEDWAWCSNLYVLSKEFTELLRLRHERFPKVSHDVFSSHYEEEIGHALMLRNWMLEMGLEDPETSYPTHETDDFISILYRAATVLDEDLSLLIINSTAEAFALVLYTECTRVLQQHGFQNLTYWTVHCEADEGHSDVLGLIDNMPGHRGEFARHFVHYTLNSIDKMLESWAR